MELPKQQRGVLLSFPSREKATPRPAKDSCPECERLEVAYQTAIDGIQAAMRGGRTVGEKLADIYRKQDERDRAIKEFYSHKAQAHARKTA